MPLFVKNVIAEFGIGIKRMKHENSRVGEIYMKHVKKERFIVETIENNKFVKVGEIEVYLQELYRKLDKSDRIFGLETFAKQKIREKNLFNLKGKSIILITKEVFFCKSEREWKNILEDRCAKCGEKINSFVDDRPDLCGSCWTDFRGD